MSFEDIVAPMDDSEVAKRPGPYKKRAPISNCDATRSAAGEIQTCWRKATAALACPEVAQRRFARPFPHR